MKLKVLVADDSATDRQVIRAMLNKIGITDVSEAFDGYQAEQKINTASAALA